MPNPLSKTFLALKRMYIYYLFISAVFLRVSSADMMNGRCFPYSSCRSQNDCNGGPCIGILLGKCTCDCIPFKRCEYDSECGAFKNSCNLKKNLCDCDGVFKRLGYNSTYTAYQEFCNKKDCRTMEDCMGGFCSLGICACPLKDLLHKNY